MRNISKKTRKKINKILLSDHFKKKLGVTQDTLVILRILKVHCLQFGIASRFGMMVQSLDICWMIRLNMWS